MTYNIPEWVFVWTWAKWKRVPAVTKAFPQEKDYTLKEVMSDEEYEGLIAEWIEAGSPRSDPIRTMTEGIEQLQQRGADIDRLISTLKETAP
jgi:hypothetical protein